MSIKTKKKRIITKISTIMYGIYVPNNVYTCMTDYPYIEINTKGKTIQQYNRTKVLTAQTPTKPEVHVFQKNMHS